MQCKMLTERRAKAVQELRGAWFPSLWELLAASQPLLSRLHRRKRVGWTKEGMDRNCKTEICIFISIKKKIGQDRHLAPIACRALWGPTMQPWAVLVVLH